MRVLITGMGGELGTRIANILERDSRVEAVFGVDVDPPRRRLHRAEFHWIDPRDAAGIAQLARELQPTALVHLGVYEPFARSSPRSAVERTAKGSIAVLEAVAATGSLDRIVVRSGIEIYGRRQGSPQCPDEDVVPDPTTPFGHVLRYTERLAQEFGISSAVPTTLLRFAPLVGPHFPSPLGRYLRLPVVPFSVMGDRPFSVLHQEDASRAIVAALRSPFDGPVNVVGEGAVTVSQAARLGGRIPLPLAGPIWRTSRFVSELVGAPVPEHIQELLVRGRTADGSRAGERLGVAPRYTSRAVIESLFDWAEVTYLAVADAEEVPS